MTGEPMDARTDAPSTASRLDSLRTDAGGFAMVALDQRESLREMFPPASDGQLVGDDALASFKSMAAELLTPAASGVLLDYPLGVPGPARPSWIAAGCGLILAADQLQSSRGAGVHGSSLDRDVDVELIRATNAAAIKFLVIWRRGDRVFQPELEAFSQLGNEAGVATFVEGIVRPQARQSWSSDHDRHDAIIEAAADLSRGATVYKAEVPGYVPGDVSRVRQQSERLSEIVDVPWVVLSNGVRQEDFLPAVTQACAGGAHGFLAGRAIWADTVPEPVPAQAIATRSVARLRALVDVVNQTRNSSRQRGSSKEIAV